EPDQVTRPTPDPMSDHESQDHYRDVHREKIGRQRDEKIVFADHHVAAVGSSLEFSYPPAEQPGPERVGQFMSEDVNPHRLGKHQENPRPAPRPAQHRHPSGVAPATSPQDLT